jgi:NAD-dependent deacetylase
MPTLDLSSYRQIVVLTGAGISVASGLPTYRGQGGLWKTSNVESYATAAAIHENPARVWSFFNEVREQIGRASPNAAHLALARAEARLRSDQTLTILTQNVDGLHQRAGSRTVVELHGSLHYSRCTGCDYRRSEDLSQPLGDCPDCPSCQSPLRPAVVLFDEALSVEAEWAAKKSLRDCDLFFAVGTSGSVSPASNFVRAAEYAGARTHYVNLEPMAPPNPAFHKIHLGPAEQVLPELLGVAG